MLYYEFQGFLFFLFFFLFFFCSRPQKSSESNNNCFLVPLVIYYYNLKNLGADAYIWILGTFGQEDSDDDNNGKEQ